MKAMDAERLQADGFCLVPQVLSEPELTSLIEAVACVATTRQASRNARRLLETCPRVAELAVSPAIRQLVQPILGPEAFVVRGLLFDKAPDANWHVGWHQDLMIPVMGRVETAGFDAWSTKAGVTHVRPPVDVLEQMLTVRLHLDDCPADNGPLMVLPGTHRHGRLKTEQINAHLEQQEPTLCTATAGDALLMRPLLLHASKKTHAACHQSAGPPVGGHRRVVHLEYAAVELPGDLAWWGGGSTSQ